MTGLPRLPRRGVAPLDNELFGMKGHPPTLGLLALCPVGFCLVESLPGACLHVLRIASPTET